MVIGQRPANGPRVPATPIKIAPPMSNDTETAEDFDYAAIASFPPDERQPVRLETDAESERLGALVTESFLKNREDLPTFPTMATRIQQLSKQPDVNMNKFVSIVSQDPTIATRILRLANSAFYSGTSEITSTRDAVVRVGLKDVANLVAAASSGVLFEARTPPTIPQFKEIMDGLWQRSMTTAFAASHLSMTLRKGDSEQVFLGGMLHDIGKMIVLRTLNGLAEAGEVSSISHYVSCIQSWSSCTTTLVSRPYPLGISRSFCWRSQCGTTASMSTKRPWRRRFTSSAPSPVSMRCVSIRTTLEKWKERSS